MRLVEFSGRQIFTQYAFFTRDEATELIQTLQEMLADESMNDLHFFDEEVSREIRLCLYDPKDISGWSEPIKRIMVDDSGDVDSVVLGPHA